MSNEQVSVLIIDDHPLFRQGVRWALENEQDITIVGEAEHGQEGIAMVEKLLPDVVLMDISLPGLSGLEVARVLKRRYPRMGIIVISMYEDDDQLFNAIRAGAAAYATKNIDPVELAQMVRQVAKGAYLINDKVLSKPHVASRILNQFRELAESEADEGSPVFAPVTSREIEILDCIARGLSNKQIANQLSISSQTVKNHITSILSKLNVNDRTMAVIYAMQRGWIKMGEDRSGRRSE